jgi:hypothetical protein
MSKKLSFLLVGIIALFLLSGCMSLFTALTIEEPNDPKSSMLILESGIDGDYLMNNNYTGWAPLVKDPSQNIVPFSMVNALADAETLYVAPNVMPGKYTLVGFRHVYTDYGLVQEGDYPNYEPYVASHYHINQEFTLDKPVTIVVKEGEMATFGYYNIEYSHNGGGFADTDDRWAVVPSSVHITSDPTNTNMLRVLKGLNTPSWNMWNVRNSAVAY